MSYARCSRRKRFPFFFFFFFTSCGRAELSGDRDNSSGVRNIVALISRLNQVKKHSSRAEVNRITRGADMHHVVKRVISQCNGLKRALSLMNNRMRLCIR